MQLTNLLNIIVRPLTRSGMDGNLAKNPVAASSQVALHAIPAGLSHHFSASCSKKRSKLLSFFISLHSTVTLLNILNHDFESSPSQPSPWNAGKTAAVDVIVIDIVEGVVSVDGIESIEVIETDQDDTVGLPGMRITLDGKEFACSMSHSSLSLRYSSNRVWPCPSGNVK